MNAWFTDPKIGAICELLTQPAAQRSFFLDRSLFPIRFIDFRGGPSELSYRAYTVRAEDLKHELDLAFLPRPEPAMAAAAPHFQP
jgi:hypothetical protein